MGYKVCLDPGHSKDIAGKCAPDKSYYEHEFALDMANRMKRLLNAKGVQVTLTRQDPYNVTLQQRVKIANAISGLHLFVSLHSNAAGNAGWSSARGYVIYTSQASDTAKRNIAAKAILNRAREAGISIRNTGIAHSLFYVLRYTTAPAVLIEHGFHTNQEEVALLKTSAYRDQLAKANVAGILDYLGIPADGLAEDTLPSLEAAVDALAQKGILNSPDYWKAGDYSPGNVQILLQKCAAALCP